MHTPHRAICTCSRASVRVGTGGATHEVKSGARRVPSRHLLWPPIWPKENARIHLRGRSRLVVYLRGRIRLVALSRVHVSTATEHPAIDKLLHPAIRRGVFYTRTRSPRGVHHAQRVCCVVAPSSASVEAHVAFRECTRRVGPFEGLIAVLLLFSHVRGHSQPRTGGAPMRKWAPEAARPGPAWLVTPLHGNLRGNHHTTCLTVPQRFI